MGDVILNGLCMFVKMYTYKNVYGMWFVFWIMAQLMHLQIEYTIADTIHNSFKNLSGIYFHISKENVKVHICSY